MLRNIYAITEGASCETVETNMIRYKQEKIFRIIAQQTEFIVRKM